MTSGFAITALNEVAIAVAELAGLSSSKGKATTEIASAVKANRKPTTVPYMIKAAPRRVEMSWLPKSAIEVGGSMPNKPKYMNSAMNTQAT